MQSKLEQILDYLHKVKPNALKNIKHIERDESITLVCKFCLSYLYTLFLFTVPFAFIVHNGKQPIQVAWWSSSTIIKILIGIEDCFCLAFNDIFIFLNVDRSLQPLFLGEDVFTSLQGMFSLLRSTNCSPLSSGSLAQGY